MNNDKKLIPNYRFPEFKDDGSWVKYRIGDYMQPYTGLTGKSGNDFGSGKPYISYKQVFDGAQIKIEDCPLVKINKNENQNKVEYGDVLITTSSETANEVGYTNVITTKINDDTYLNSFCFGLKPTDLNFPNVLFSKYLFRNNEYRNAVILLAQGVTRYNISKTKVVELKLSMPSNPAEQQKIAACLSSLDDVIAGHEEKLTLLEEHKKGLMQNLFPQEGETQPKYRFPEFENDGDWVEKKLGEVATFLNGRAYKQEELLDKGKYRVLRVGNFFTNNQWYYSDLELEENKYCDHGDLLYAWSASFGPKIWTGEKVIYHYHIWKVLPQINISNQFLYYLLDLETLHMKTRSLNGFALMHITKGAIENWDSIVPVNLNEQQKIASVLSSVDELIVAQREKIASLKEHKKGLMQGLFPKLEA